MWIFSISVIYYLTNIFSKRARIINPTPRDNIAHFKNFFVPLSFEVLKSCKSLDPTSAPEKPFESGDIINDTIIIITATTRIIIETISVSMLLLNINILYYILDK
ncbi:putative transmembrane protein [Mycoplasmopsis bovigenitalium]|nr:putative transmembrane protein [Mycoplasmopsis bovigenitalium]